MTCRPSSGLTRCPNDTPGGLLPAGLHGSSRPRRCRNASAPGPRGPAAASISPARPPGRRRNRLELLVASGSTRRIRRRARRPSSRPRPSPTTAGVGIRSSSSPRSPRRSGTGPEQSGSFACRLRSAHEGAVVQAFHGRMRSKVQASVVPLSQTKRERAAGGPTSPPRTLRLRNSIRRALRVPNRLHVIRGLRRRSPSAASSRPKASSRPPRQLPAAGYLQPLNPKAPVAGYSARARCRLLPAPLRAPSSFPNRCGVALAPADPHTCPAASVSPARRPGRRPRPSRAARRCTSGDPGRGATARTALCGGSAIPPAGRSAPRARARGGA